MIVQVPDEGLKLGVHIQVRVRAGTEETLEPVPSIIKSLIRRTFELSNSSFNASVLDREKNSSRKSVAKPS